MMPVEERRTPLVARRNRHGFLLGMGWPHDPRFGGPRLTHFYLGWWVVTLRTGWENPPRTASTERSSS